MIITLVIESNSGPATQEDAATWASDYGLTFPVLADPNNTGWNYIQTYPGLGGSYGLPNKQLLSQTFDFVFTIGFSGGTIFVRCFQIAKNVGIEPRALQDCSVKQPLGKWRRG